MPPERSTWWDFDEETDHAPHIQDMITAIVTYGHPFMEAHASLPAITEALLHPAERYTSPAGAGLRSPIAFYLLGDYERALTLLHPSRCGEEPEIVSKLRQRINQAKQGIGPQPPERKQSKRTHTKSSPRSLYDALEPLYLQQSAEHRRKWEEELWKEMESPQYDDDERRNLKEVLERLRSRVAS